MFFIFYGFFDNAKNFAKKILGQVIYRNEASSRELLGSSKEVRDEMFNSDECEVRSV